MKVKIITEKDESKLEKKVNDFLKKNKAINIQVKPVAREKMINKLSTCEKQEYYTNDFMATIIYEG